MALNFSSKFTVSIFLKINLKNLRSKHAISLFLETPEGGESGHVVLPETGTGPIK